MKAMLAKATCEASRIPPMGAASTSSAISSFRPPSKSGILFYIHAAEVERKGLLPPAYPTGCDQDRGSRDADRDAFHHLEEFL